MSHEANGTPPSSEALMPEYFDDATLKTREDFEVYFEQLGFERISTVQHDYVEAYEGDLGSFTAHVSCGIKKTYDFDHDTTTVEPAVSVTIASSSEPPTPDIMEALRMDPLKSRVFEGGESWDQADMTDADYEAAMKYLALFVRPDRLAWIENARLLAGTIQDQVYLPTEVKKLLETYCLQSPVFERTLCYIYDVLFNDGTTVSAQWTTANRAFIRGQDDDYITRTITLELPTGEQYSYTAYKDGTEQMLVEARDKATREALRQQGYPTMALGDWSNITRADRRMGIQAPTEVMMRQFNKLLAQTLKSGLQQI